MNPKSDRRRFFDRCGWWGLTGTLLLGPPAAVAAGQQLRVPSKARNIYSGTSQNGSIDEAIQAATQAAMPPGQADRIVAWRLLEVKGRTGGITGLREVTATIEAAVE